MGKKRIVIITSGQPSINPRMVKEADALVENYEVIVVYQYWNSWATEIDKQLLKSKKWKAIRVGGDPVNCKLIFDITRLLHWLTRRLTKLLGFKFFLAELSISRSSYLLLFKAIALKADLYIGHNPGAMPIAAIAAKKRGVKCGFDAEDFHRYEYSDDPNHLDVTTKKYLEEKYFPQYNYLTTASPLITREYSKHFPALNFTTLLNVFEKTSPAKISPQPSTEPLKLFWFSQTIGHNRGLEDIIHAIYNCCSKNVELHILGNPREIVIARLQELAMQYNFEENQVNFYNPIPPDEIFNLASRFDVGMATEIGEPYNRDICLTNKIFTYLQAGLAIIASNTSSQIHFLNENPGIGFIYEKKNIESLTLQIKKLFADKPLLNSIKQHNYQLGQSIYNWENESQKFLSIIEQVLA